MTITGRPQAVNKVIITLKGPLEGKVPISLVRSNLTNNLTKLGRIESNATILANFQYENSILSCCGL